MTKKFITIIVAICALSYNAINAQCLKITYNETFDIEAQLNNIKDPSIREAVKSQIAGTDRTSTLYINKGESCFYYNDGIIYRNMSQKQKISQESILDRQFIINEKLTEYDWHLDNEEKEILNYKCKKATYSGDNKNITAWYYPDIPVNNGPQSYWGLPGLILQIEMEKLTITAQSIDLNSADAATAIIKPDKGQEITRAEFNELKIKKMKDISSDGNITVIKF